MTDKEQYLENIEIALQAINNPETRENKEFRDWIAKDENLQLYEELVVYRMGMLQESDTDISIDIVWKKFIEDKKRRSKKVFRIYWTVASAVAAVAIIFLLRIGTEQNLNLQTAPIPEYVAKNEPQEILLKTDNEPAVVITPKFEPQVTGKRKTPTKQVFTANESNIVTKNKKAKKYHISIPRGTTYYLMLEDSTEVWLNVDSELKFPAQFKKDIREVELIGEGYFKVKEDTSRPFIVKSKYLTTRVLGTEFNFRAYNREEAEVTLVSGKVAVNSSDKQITDEVILTPNQTARVVNNQFQTSNTDVRKYTAWTEGLFYFDNETLEDIMKVLGRWYNVNILFQDNSTKNYRFKFSTNRAYSLSQVTEMLNQMGKVSIETKGNNTLIKERQ